MNGSDTGDITVASEGIDSSTATAGSTGSETGGCLPPVSVDPFVMFAETSFGLLRVFDMNEDGRDDIVGGRGAVALSTDGELAVSFMPAAPMTNDARPGLFGGASGPDLVFATSTGSEIWTYLDGGAFTGDDPVVTPAATAWAFDSRDLDTDGYSDLIVQIDGGQEIWIWRGSASGVFEKGVEIDVGFAVSATAVRFEPPRIDLAIGEPSLGIRIYESDGEGAFVETDLVEQPGVFALIPTLNAGSERESALVGWYWDNGIEESEGAGFLEAGARGWMAKSYDVVPPGLVALPSSADFDGDGGHDLMLAFSTRIDLVCSADDGELYLCGTIDVTSPPESVVFFDDARARKIAYSTVSDGAWIADLHAVPCR